MNKDELQQRNHLGMISRKTTLGDLGCLNQFWGWLCVAKVLCILRHWGIQLILASSWARQLYILVAGKGRGGMFLFLLFLHFSFLFLFFSLSLIFISCTFSSNAVTLLQTLSRTLVEFTF